MKRMTLEEMGISPLLRMAMLLGVLAHLAGFFIFRVVSSPLPAREETPAFIEFVSGEPDQGDAELMEQASLFDSAPLFIPGEWSAASGVFTELVDLDGRAFPQIEPEINLTDAVKPARLTFPQAANVREVGDLLDLRFWDLFDSFGQLSPQRESPPPWRSVVYLSILDGGGDSAYRELDGVVAEFESAETAVRPLDLMVNMEAPGLPIGAPLIEQSSGSDVLDEEVLEWMKRPGTLANLPAGLLRLRVFP